MVESHWASGKNKSHVGSSEKNSTDENNCWLNEEYEIVKECHPCTDFEITSKSIGVCVATHFKELLKCRVSGKIVSRSCDKVAWLEERNFWIFEGCMFVLGLISTTIVFARQKILDHQMLRRVQRQLASGV
ncbi:hypothetical protein L9F63_013622 [Diploptera punctata]|uniref:Protein JTB n=1 Tax=Diploptera punctata TaxID=6984 RepID=A0AAD8AAI0_DIPPU|nr:hypothetical protein L9F63_013622 [Diploptera punctata]